jgi:hypothetical protein
MSDLFRPPSQEPPVGGADYGWGTERPVQADIPAQGAPRQKRAGWLAGLLAFAGLVLGKLKFLAIFLLKFKGIAATAISTGVTALIYAQVFGWMFGSASSCSSWSTNSATWWWPGRSACRPPYLS